MRLNSFFIVRTNVDIQSKHFSSSFAWVNHTATLEGLTGLHGSEAETALWAEEHLMGQCW